MSQTVKKVVFADKNKVVTEVDKRSFTLRRDDVLIETHYSCISAGTELAKLSGLQTVKYPLSLGNRAIGRVLEIGDGVKHVKPGDLVFAHTAHASHVVTSGLTARLPEALDRPATATLGMAMVALVGVQTAGVELGDTAVVTGAGLVGQFAAQLLELSGVRTIVTDRSEGRLQIAMECGVSHTLEAGDDLKERIWEITGGKGAEAILECTGIPVVAEQAAAFGANSATMVLVGSPRGEHPADFTQFLNHFHLWQPHGNLTLKGSHEWKIPKYEDAYLKHSLARNCEILVKLITSGKLRIDPLLSKVYRFDEAASAYEDLQYEKDRVVLGAVFDWTTGGGTG